MRKLILALLLLFSVQAHSFGTCTVPLEELQESAMTLSERRIEPFAHPTYKKHKIWPWGKGVAAIYVDKFDLLNINERLFDVLPADIACAILVHEYVHVLQARLEYIPLADIEEREMEAYRIQTKYLYGVGAGDDKTIDGIRAVVSFKKIQRHIANVDMTEIPINCHDRKAFCRSAVSKGDKFNAILGKYYYPIRGTIRVKWQNLLNKLH